MVLPLIGAAAVGAARGAAAGVGAVGRGAAAVGRGAAKGVGAAARGTARGVGAATRKAPSAVKNIAGKTRPAVGGEAANLGSRIANLPYIPIPGAGMLVNKVIKDNDMDGNLGKKFGNAGMKSSISPFGNNLSENIANNPEFQNRLKNALHENPSAANLAKKVAPMIKDKLGDRDLSDMTPHAMANNIGGRIKNSKEAQDAMKHFARQSPANMYKNLAKELDQMGLDPTDPLRNIAKDGMKASGPIGNMKALRDMAKYSSKVNKDIGAGRFRGFSFVLILAVSLDALDALGPGAILGWFLQLPFILVMYIFILIQSPGIKSFIMRVMIRKILLLFIIKLIPVLGSVIPLNTLNVVLIKTQVDKYAAEKIKAGKVAATCMKSMMPIGMQMKPA